MIGARSPPRSEPANSYDLRLSATLRRARSASKHRNLTPHLFVKLRLPASYAPYRASDLLTGSEFSGQIVRWAAAIINLDKYRR